MNILRARSLWISMVLMVPAAVILLGTLACLPAPVGEPEKAVVNKDLVGAWELVEEKGGKTSVLVTMRPLDGKTYVSEYIQIHKDGEKTKVQVMMFHTWLTEIAKKPFVCMEYVNDEQSLKIDGAEEDDRFYVVGAIEMEKGKLQFRLLKGWDDKGPLAGLKTREEFEAAIAKNIDNEGMYADVQTYRKLGKDDLELLREFRKAAGMKTNPDKIDAR